MNKLTSNKIIHGIIKTVLGFSFLILLNACSDKTPSTASDPASDVVLASEVAPVSAPPPESDTVALDSTPTADMEDVISTLKRGEKYTYYGEGEKCSENCITKEQAHQLCNKITGYTQNMMDLIINGGITNERDGTVLKNTSPHFSSSWDGNMCQGVVTADGMYEGTSAHVNIQGKIETYGLTDSGTVLADYMDIR